MKCSAFLFMLLPFLAFAGKDGETAEKKIKREFSIQANGHLGIDNKYGDLDIAIGPDNQIKFDITILATASSIKKAEEAIQRITVDFNEGLNRVDAVTQIESSSSWSSWFNSSGNQSIEINYQVLVPRSVYLELQNKFGNIYLESTDRDAKIDLSYGEIRLGDINADLDLNIAYSEGSLSQIKNGDLHLAYSEIEMENSQALKVEMKYSELAMGSSIRLNAVSSYGDLKGDDVDEVNYSGKYDDVRFERVKTISADCAYTGVEVGGLATSGSFDMRYGDLSIDNVWPGFKNINISTSYTGVEIGFQEGASFTLDAQTSYCDVNPHGDFKVSERITQDSRTTLKATRGSGGGMVKAVMSYGELNIE